MGKIFSTVAVQTDGTAQVELRTFDLQEAHADFHRLIFRHRDDPAIALIAAYYGDDPDPFSIRSFGRAPEPIR